MSLSDYKDIHSGERVFILGNGPSLNDTPLEDLKKEKTIAVNKINRIYENTSWRPTYLVTRDIQEHEIDDIEESISEGVQCFISRDNIHPSKDNDELFGERDNVEYFDTEVIPFAERRKALSENNADAIWSVDIEEKICGFGSSIALAAQIAHYMGFEEIYFLGCDLFDIPTKHMMFDSGGDPSSVRNPDGSTLAAGFNLIRESGTPVRTLTNCLAFYALRKLPSDILPSTTGHFIEGYDDNYPKRWGNEKLRSVHKLIKENGEIHGFEVYNAGIGGKLEVYERVDLETLLRS